MIPDSDPDGTGPKDPIVRQYRYDSRARSVAQRVSTDANWTCITYDSRARVTSQKDSSAKTTLMGYSVPDKVTTTYKDSSGADRTTVSKSDWMGRALSYTDENGSATRSVYDQMGRVTATYRSSFGQPESQLSSAAFDPNSGRMTSMSEYASGAARATSFSYDDAGRLLSATRPNGVVSTNSFASNRGWLNSISNKKDTTELSAWSYSHNPSGDISSETGAGRTRAFTYDNAGRLTKTAQTGASAATRNYSYDANSNRCSTTTACDSSYDYDSADRLLASPSATAYSYDQHGSVTSATPTRATATYSPDLSGSVGAAQTKTETVAPSAAGTVSATLDWQPTTAEVQKDETVTALGQKDYTLKVSPNGTVAASVSWPSQTLNPNLDLILLDSSGAEVSSSKQLTGNSESISYAVTGIGTYPDSKTFTLRIKALATGSDFTLSYSHPATADLDLQLFNPSGTKVAESASSSTRPEAVSFNVTTGSAGDYSLKVVSKDFATAYSLSASYPRSPELKVSYDANDHATQTDDGTMVNKETLSPSGRVLRRVVTDPAGKVTEDTTFGYDDRGDSPAYSRPTGGGSIATYVEGPSGLLAIDTGGTPSYPISNAHGDIAGTTDANGNFTANPDSDEFGAGPQPSNRLGWLGAKQRYSTGGSLALIRMGVRLYDPSLGRFLQVDPVEGGSANDYDYGWQDPVNNLDLDGRAVMKPLRWLFKEANKHFTIRRGRPAFHWRNNQNRIEWDPKNRWHFNDDLARKGKHLSVRRGLWEASRRGATNGFRAAGRGLKAASRFLGSAPYLLVPIPGRLACRAVDNGSGSCRRPNYAA